MDYTPILPYAYSITKYDLDGYSYEDLRSHLTGDRENDWTFEQAVNCQKKPDGTDKPDYCRRVGFEFGGTVFIWNLTGQGQPTFEQLQDIEFDARQLVAILHDHHATYENAMAAIKEYETGQ